MKTEKYTSRYVEQNIFVENVTLVVAMTLFYHYDTIDNTLLIR